MILTFRVMSGKYRDSFLALRLIYFALVGHLPYLKNIVYSSINYFSSY